METARNAAHRGMLKLMLRLPSLREELRRLWPADPSFEALCEAYEDATTTLERLVKHPGDGDEELVEEYRAVCRALETDVVVRCHGNVSRL